MDGKYTIELCRPGGESAGIERVFERQDDLIVMLCDRARVLARSDRPDTMPD
jgi:hypothetical protein